ncbi:AlpA family phage regulatory protein, partial [Pseudomonas aeruginosa]
MKIIRLSGVIETTGLARSTIYKLISEGGFPRPVPLVGCSGQPIPDSGLSFSSATA